MPQIDKVLIANRGEIAVRVIRACRELEIATVAVYSEVDLHSPHVHLADEAVPLGPPAAAESYLAIDKLVAAAQATGAQAIHPGYGFLAENAAFARAIEEAGLTLIGPSSEVIARMGDKVAARETAIQAGVPVVPGALDQEGARELGYPLLVKAAYGGGGKGMRVVREAGELELAVSEAAREATSAFGNGTLYFERFLLRPRHIEIQVLADEHGHVVHLGERECSLQRRHQKLIEETPSTAVDDALRERMGEAAVALARSVGYRSAGTVEFMLDEDGSFYLIEMNTRLQVEHTVTEMVTGVDIVKEQLHIARGQPLSVRTTPTPRGHAIQCRISAEDPLQGFAPSTGVIQAYRTPRGPGVRVDDGVQAGTEITLYYDPLFAKVMAWGAHRDEALDRMASALREYLIVGVHSTIPFHLAMLADEEFRAGRTDITFVPRRWQPETARGGDPELAAIVATMMEHLDRQRRLPLRHTDTGAWRRLSRGTALRREAP